jgi:hypothetical protein
MRTSVVVRRLKFEEKRQKNGSKDPPLQLRGVLGARAILESWSSEHKLKPVPLKPGWYRIAGLKKFLRVARRDEDDSFENDSARC